MKPDSKKHSLLFTLPVLAALVFGTIVTTDAFAEDAFGIPVDKVSPVRTDALSAVSVESPDTRAEVEFDGITEGWAIISGVAYPASITLDGNAIHHGNGVWKVASDSTISVGERDVPLELKGKAVNGKLRLHGTGELDNGESFRLILRGNYAPIYDQPGQFVVDWSFAKIQNMENGFRLPLFINGEITVTPVVPVTDEIETDLNTEE